MIEYFEQKRNIVDSLADCSHPVSDDDFISAVLHGLDSSYGPLRAALNIKLDTLDPDNLLGFLLREEERLADEARTAAASQPAANFGQQRGGSSRRGSSDRPPSRQSSC